MLEGVQKETDGWGNNEGRGRTENGERQCSLLLSEDKDCFAPGTGRSSGAEDNRYLRRCAVGVGKKRARSPGRDAAGQQHKRGNMVDRTSHCACILKFLLIILRNYEVGQTNHVSFTVFVSSCCLNREMCTGACRYYCTVQYSAIPHPGATSSSSGVKYSVQDIQSRLPSADPPSLFCSARGSEGRPPIKLKDVQSACLYSMHLYCSWRRLLNDGDHKQP